MTMTVTTVGSYSTHPVNAMLESQFLRRAQQVCPYFYGTQPGQMAMNGGTATIKWSRWEQETPTTTPLTEVSTASYGNGRTADTPSRTDVVATIAKYGQFYILNEEVDVLSVNGTAMELMDVLGESAGRSLNMLQRDIAEDNATQRYGSNVASTGAVHSVVAAGDLNYAINELSRNSARTFTPMTSGSQNIGTAPILSSYWAITHPDAAYDVAQVSGFTSVEKYGQQTALVEGEFGYYGVAGRGVRFIQSEDSSIDTGSGAPLSGSDFRSTSGSTDVYTIVIYGRDAFGSVGLGKRHTDGVYRAGDNTGGWQIISKPRGSAGAGDPFDEISTMAWKAWHVGAALNANWSRSIRVAATNLSN